MRSLLRGVFLLLLFSLGAPSSVQATDYYIEDKSWPVIVNPTVGYPQGPSVSLLSGFTLDEGEGFYGVVEVGVNGWRAGGGVGMFGAHFLHLAVELSALRTWRDDLGIAANQTLIGSEVLLGYGMPVVRLGVYRNISDGPDDWVFTVRVGAIIF